MCCASSHGGHQHAPDAEVYPWDWENYCLCMGYGLGVAGTVQRSGCCGAQSGDDKLCDRCREHCQKERKRENDSSGASTQSVPAAVG